MLFKEPEMAIITTTTNTHVYIEITDDFLIPSTENWFGDNEVISHDNASFHRVKGIKAFLKESL